VIWSHITGGGNCTSVPLLQFCMPLLQFDILLPQPGPGAAWSLAASSGGRRKREDEKEVRRRGGGTWAKCKQLLTIG